MKEHLNIFKIFDEKKINYVVWKNINLINDFLEGKENLDLLIDFNKKKIGEKLLSENGWVEVISNVKNLKNIKHYLYFGYKKTFHLHIYYKLRTGNTILKEYDFSLIHNFLEKKIYNKEYNLWILDYNYQFALFKIRLLIKNSNLLGRYLYKRELDYLTAEYNHIKNHLNNNSDVEILNLNEIINHKDFLNKLFIPNIKECKKFINSFSKYLIMNNVQQLIFIIFFLYKVLIKRILRKKQFKLKKTFYLFISGPDSSGKSTIIYYLNKILSTKTNVKKYTIAKPYPKFLLSYFFKKKYFIKKDYYKSKKPRKNSFIYLIKCLNLSILRYIYHLIIFYFTPNGSVALLDRYVSKNEGEINGPRITLHNKANKIEKIFSFLEKLFYSSIRNIEYEFKLDTNLNIALERNKSRNKKISKSDKEIQERFYKFQKSKFKSINIIKIDNNKKIEFSINNILFNIAKYYK